MPNKFSVYDPIKGRNRKFKEVNFVSYVGSYYGNVLFNGNVLLQDGTTLTNIFEQPYKYRKVEKSLRIFLTKNFQTLL